MAQSKEKTYTLYTTKEADKDKGYHKFWGKHIMTSHLTWRHYVRLKMSESYRYMNGEQANSNYESLFKAFEIPSGKKDSSGSQMLTLPYVYINFNKVRNRVKAQLGELSSLGFEMEAQAINSEAKTEKTKMIQRVMAQMKLRPYMKNLAEKSGVEIGIDQELPETIEEAQDFFKHTYKQNSEIVLEACLRYNIAYYGYLSMRLELFMDALTTGECHAKSVVVNGYPVLKKCNPLTVGYRADIDDNDFLDKANIFYEYYYLDVNQVLSLFPDIKKEDIDELKKKGGDSGVGKMYQGIHINDDILAFTPFDESGNRVLVFEARWIDTRKVLHVCKKHKDGTTISEVLYGEDAEKKYKLDAENTKEKGVDITFKRKEIGWTRHVTLIAGEIVPENHWGACEYMLRDPARPEIAHHEYVSLKPFNIQGSNVSEIDVVKPIQDFLNFIVTKIQLEITKSGGSAIAIDTSKIPKEFGSDPRTALREVLYHLKAAGLIFYNGSQGEQLPTGAIPIERFDTGLGASITQLMAVFQLLESQLEDVGSVSRQMRGEQVSANQLAGVLQMNLQQAHKVNKPLYDKFFEFESRLLTKHGQHVRMTFNKHPERYKHIIGDLYYLFLDGSVDFVRDYHKVIIKAQPVSQNKLEKYLVSSVQQGNLSAHEALEVELMAEDSVKEAIRMYLKKTRAAEKQRQEQQMMAMMQQMQAQQQAQQEALAQQAQMQNLKYDREERIVDKRGQFDREKTAMKETSKRMKIDSDEKRELMDRLEQDYQI